MCIIKTCKSSFIRYIYREIQGSNAAKGVSLNIYSLFCVREGGEIKEILGIEAFSGAWDRCRYISVYLGDFAVFDGTVLGRFETFWRPMVMEWLWIIAAGIFEGIFCFFLTYGICCMGGETKHSENIGWGAFFLSAWNRSGSISGCLDEFGIVRRDFRGSILGSWCEILGDCGMDG